VRAVTVSAPRWLVGAKVVLAALLVVGAVFPGVGGFEGKGMAFRLPIFLAPALAVPLARWRRRGPYPAALDAALTLPFLFDTAANAVGLYDAFEPTDDVLHALNWFVLVGGVTAWIAARLVARPAGSPAESTPRWLLTTAGAGIGAMAIIGWEVAEYAVMEAGVGGLSLTYGDTLGDLVLSTVGGAIGAAAALRWIDPRTPGGAAGTGAPDAGGARRVAPTAPVRAARLSERRPSQPT
jgi:hypothetical protein